MTHTEITAEINRLQKRHPGTRRQRSVHGPAYLAASHSVQFFDRATGTLVADYTL